MNKKELLSRRYAELAAEFSKLIFYHNENGSKSHDQVENGLWRKWATSAQHLIQITCGNGSPHFDNFTSIYVRSSGYRFEMGGMNAVFESARSDFEGDYIFELESIISGEIFGDFVALAKQSLADGHKNVAAVLASAALEDALKRFARANEIIVDQKSMDEVVNALKGKGLVSGAQKSLLDVMPKIRNFALHADWDKLTEPDVNSIIGYVENFLLTKFSGS